MKKLFLNAGHLYLTISLALLCVWACSKSKPDSPDKPVIDWLHRISYYRLYQFHGDPGPFPDWPGWAADGEKIPEIRKTLERMLQTSDRSVELPLVARALALLGGRSSIPALEGALDSDDSYLRLEACGALKQLLRFDLGAVQCLGRRIREDKNTTIRANAVIALREMEAGPARQYLIDASQDEHPWVQELAREALQKNP